MRAEQLLIGRTKIETKHSDPPRVTADLTPAELFMRTPGEKRASIINSVKEILGCAACEQLSNSCYDINDGAIAYRANNGDEWAAIYPARLDKACNQHDITI